jgi:hypothetical protein
MWLPGRIFGACLLSTVIVALGTTREVSTQKTDCRQQDLIAALQPNDRAYAFALELSQALQRGGFVVKCVLRSHWENAFEGLAGAALYRTDRGDFEALFLTPPETFDKLAIVEHREGPRFVYSFEGHPRPGPGDRIDSARPMHYVKDEHRLLITWGDESVATRLRQTLAAAERR